jgi:hypothetical protein
MPNAPASTRLVFWPANAALLALALILTACGSSGNTVTSPSTISKCSVAFDTPGSTVPASGGSGSISVKTARECQWTAQPEVNWLSITAGASGQGDGAVQFNAAANGDPVARSGGVMVNGLRAQITQAAGECRFELAGTSASFGQAGGTGSVELRASSPLCTWTAASDAEWIAITSNVNGKGSSPVAFTVAARTGAPRTGTLTIAGLHFNVTQSEGCTFAIAPVSYAVGATGGSQVVTVTAGPGCPWTASSNVDWITVSAATGTGTGAVTTTVARTTGPSRTGTVTIAGHALVVTQSPGCTLDVSPLAHNVDAAGGTRTVNVTGGAGCDWSASSTQPWITIASGASGSGPGTVTFAVAAATGPSRSGTLIVAGQTVTVTQGAGCAFGISPDAQSVPASGGNGTVSVTASAGCAWTSNSNVPWITVTSGASGTGDGSVNFTVAATTGAGRSGTLTIAGRTFTVNQGQGCAFSLSSTSASVPAAGGTGAFDVRAADGCGWAAESNAPWLTITAGANGSGNATVRYAAAANSGPQRIGTITAAGQTYSVTQNAGCSAVVTPDTIPAPAVASSANVAVSTAAGCSWTAAVNNTPWITIAAPAGGTGDGTGNVQLVIQANTGPARTGTATIADKTVTVNQSSGCTISIAPTAQLMPAGAGSGLPVIVTTAAGCAWTATSNNSNWLTVTAGASGSGPGTVQFTVEMNQGTAQRVGTITIGTQTFTVTQAGK